MSSSEFFCESQLEFLRQGLQMQLRQDGRSRQQRQTLRYQSESDNLPIFPNCNGAIKFQIPSSDTLLMFGLKVEIANYQNQQTSSQSTQPNTQSSQPSKSSSAPSDSIMIKIEQEKQNFKSFNQKLESKSQFAVIESYLKTKIIQQLDQSFLKINQKDLQKNLYWKVYIDVFIQGPFNLSQIEFLSHGIRLLLQETQVPQLVVNFNQISEKHEIEVGEGQVSLISPEILSGINHLFVAGVHEQTVFYELSMQESEAMDQLFLVCQNSKGDVTHLEKVSSDSVELQQIGALVTDLARNPTKFYTLNAHKL